MARAAAAIADGMSNVSTVGLFCASRPAVFESPAALSTLRRAVFALGGELMAPGLDRVLAHARSRAWQAAGYGPASLDRSMSTRRCWSAIPTRSRPRPPTSRGSAITPSASGWTPGTRSTCSRQVTRRSWSRRARAATWSFTSTPSSSPTTLHMRRGPGRSPRAPSSSRSCWSTCSARPTLAPSTPAGSPITHAATDCAASAWMPSQRRSSRA